MAIDGDPNSENIAIAAGEKEFLEPVPVESSRKAEDSTAAPHAWHIGRGFIDPLVQKLEEWRRKPKEYRDDLEDLQGLEMRLYGMGYPDDVASFDHAMAWLQVRKLDNIRTSLRRRLRNVSRKSLDLESRLEDPTVSPAAADSWYSQFSLFEHSVVEPFIRYLRNLKLELEDLFPHKPSLASAVTADTPVTRGRHEKTKTTDAKKKPTNGRGRRPDPLTRQRAKFAQKRRDRKNPLTYPEILKAYRVKHRSDVEVNADALRLARKRVYGPENQTDEPSGG